MPPLDAENQSRESPLSIARKWLPWCLALIFAMTAGWTALVVWSEVSGGNHEGVVDTAIAVVNIAAPAAPLIVLYAILTTSTLDMLGGLAVVTAKYLTDKFLDPWREKRRAEALAKGRAKGLEEGRAEGLEEGRTEGLEEGRTEGLEEGRTEGLEEGRAEERRKWTEWNQRRLEAISMDLSFDEPPPTD